MAGSVPVLLITANVGSIFEEPSVMLKIWTEEFLSTISRLDPKFIALHCQEVGGKNYEQSMRHVEYFVRLLMSSEELRLFDKVRVFLDEDYSSAEHFTALGNFYFVHESIKDVLLWDFKECSFVPANGNEVYSGNIEAVTTKEKAKFPQDFFPECKWSRKGFLRTRWSISGTVFDLINIHLFHDASNFVAMETFPSVYSKTRRRALEHTLDRFHNDQYPNVPYFLFGDFNFRTDTAGVIKKLTEDTQESKLPSKGGISRLQFHNKDNNLILTLGKKEFAYYEHQDVFNKNSGQWLHEYDKELEDFKGRLLEFPISFLPSYPFEEDIKEGRHYMKTRVPAWCDRVLLSPTAKTLVQNISVSNAVEYGIIGPSTCMGDHKPVYLRVALTSDAGTVSCCHLANAPQFCFRVPDSYVDWLSTLPDYRNCASAQAAIDRSANFLHAVPLKHDPYTPDSMDSPSPNAIVALGEVPDVDLDNPDTIADPASTVHTVRTGILGKRIDRAVSPSLLKSKLELIVQSEQQESLDSEFDNTDIRRSPSECHLHSRLGAHEDAKSLRKNRSNSDVSWQRSHLLTRAWLHDSGQPVYRSFDSNFAHESSSSLSLTETTGGLTSDLIIPRIAIITASNFESNESSVHQYNDRCSVYSDNRLSTYSDNRTKTVSGEGSSLEKSDEIYSKIEEESEKVSSNTEDDMGTIEETSSREPEKHILLERTSSNCSRGNSLIEKVISRDEQNNLRNLSREITGASPKPQGVLTRVIETRSLTTQSENQNISKDVNKNSWTIDNSVEVTVRSLKHQGYMSETIEADRQATKEYRSMNREMREGQSILSSSLSHDATKYEGDAEVVFVEQNIGKYNVAYDTRTAASTKPESLEKRDSDVSVIDDTIHTFVPIKSANEIEFLRSDSRQDMSASKNSTRSNSTYSQDANENTGKIKLHLKACKVAETDIVSRSRCNKCCCVIS